VYPTVKPKDESVAVFDENSLKKASEQGKITLSVNKSVKNVILPIRAAEFTGGTGIQIKFDQVTVELPVEVLKEAMNESGFNQDQLQITVAMLEPSAANNVLVAGQKNNTGIRLDGSLYDFSVSVISNQGKQKLLTPFKKPVTLSFNAKPEVNGIYLIGDDNSLTYVGGRIANGSISAELEHSSRYGVLGYKMVYSDLSDFHWAYNAIQSLSVQQIITTGSDKFEPARVVTRGEFAAMLVRLLHLTPAQSSFESEMTAAAQAGIVTGKGSGKMELDDNITRQEMAVMLIRAYKLRTGTATVTHSAVNRYTDESRISLWALDAVKEATVSGLLNGKTRNHFDPHSLLNRAEAAKVVHSLLGKN